MIPAWPRHCDGLSNGWLERHWETGKASQLPKARRRRTLAPPAISLVGGKVGMRNVERDLTSAPLPTAARVSGRAA